MATVRKIEPAKTQIPLGILSLAEFINSHGSPTAKIVEVSKFAVPFKVDIHDPNFDKPIASLTKTYPD